MQRKRPISIAVGPSQVFKLVEAVVRLPKEPLLLSEAVGEHGTHTTVISD